MSGGPGSCKSAAAAAFCPGLHGQYLARLPVDGVLGAAGADAAHVLQHGKERNPFGGGPEGRLSGTAVGGGGQGRDRKRGSQRCAARGATGRADARAAHLDAGAVPALAVAVNRADVDDDLGRPFLQEGGACKDGPFGLQGRVQGQGG